MSRLLKVLALLAALSIGVVGPAHALQIIPQFDASITGDPNGAILQQTIRAVIAVYEANLTDNLTVKIKFELMNTGLGRSATAIQTNSYLSYRAALQAHATSADDFTAITFLPMISVNPVDADPNVFVKQSLGRLLGLPNPFPASLDSTISLNTSLMNLQADIAGFDPQKYSLYATVAHELDEALGFGSRLDRGMTGAIQPEDLFRYDLTGARSFTTNALALAYFSLDGQNRLAQFNQLPEGDFGDWYSIGGQIPQVQDAFGTPGAHPDIGVEWRVLDAIGYTRSPGSSWVDFSFPTISNLNAGTFDLPFNSLVSALLFVPSGGTALIKSSNSTAVPLRIARSTPMRLVAVNGTVHIGR